MAKIEFARVSVAGCAVCSLLATLSGCGNAGEPVGSQRAPLVAVCAENVASVPDGFWLCGEPRTVECDARPGTASPATIYAVSPDGCDDRRLLVEEGPFAVGEHEIVVSEQVDVAGSASPTLRELCRSALNVVDTTPPRANPAHATLWPPNHELHAISANECAGVVDACDAQVAVRFTAATSDEPADAKGDGAFEPDIAFDGAQAVWLRAERQGPSNGRVYTLSWLARDAAGNELAGACTVEVPHDQGGQAAVADAPAYNVTAPPAP
jgi:hypothetical protein